MASRIEDYALIGDCRGSALVGKDGSIDWLCLPRFDSAACFASLLGTDEHGRWQIAPVEPVTNIRRRYLDGTLVLESEIETAGGLIRLTDFMVPQTESSDVFRVVEGVRGEVAVRSELAPRFDYGSILPWVRRAEREIRATAGPDTLYYRSDARSMIADRGIVAEFIVAEGQQVAFQLSWGETHQFPPPVRNPQQMHADTIACWQDWSNRCTYEGPWRRDVLSSLITLKALIYEPTGGIVAAPTTSLPEQLGGGRNWDYRYCWIRDATFTLYAFLMGGYIEEARAWRQWLVHAAAGDPSDLQIMYGLGGERRLTELELGWLPGYEDSRPVRTGNGAYRQRQLDVPGELMEALHMARRHGLAPCEDAWRVQTAVMNFLESNWHEPDEGIWEIRGPRRHFTHSKVMAWAAADRAVQDVEVFGLPGDVQRWRRLRNAIREEVVSQGFNSDVGAFVQYYGSDQPDASLLMLPLIGFVRADDPKMKGTVALIEKHLVRDGLVDRYRTEENVDGLEGDEGAFLLCSFWLADNYALAGRKSEAKELFQMLLGLRNDVGLLSEEFDASARRMVGNFPQAFSHVGLINSARILTTLEIPVDAPSDEAVTAVPP